MWGRRLTQACRELNVSGWVGARGQVLGLEVGSGVGVRVRVDIIVLTLSPMLSHLYLSG